VQRGWAATVEMAKALVAAVVLLQRPASFTPTPTHLRKLGTFLEGAQKVPLRLAREPHGDWPEAVIRCICARYRIVHVADPLTRAPVTGDVAYFRLHGRTGYTDADLGEIWARCQGFREAFVFFNNVSMREDAQRFREMIRRRPSSPDLATI